MISSNPSHAAREQFKSLTGLRFVAACGVLFLHSGSGFSHATRLPAVITTFLKHGYMGVCIFFVLSGFILTYTYTTRLQTAGAVGYYMLARFARIYPIYLLALLIALPLLASVPDARTATSVLLLVQSWTPAKSENGYSWIMQAWTLSAEFFFYLLLPFVIPIFARLPKRTLMQIVVVLAVIIVGLGGPTITPGALRSTYGSVVDWFLPVPKVARISTGSRHSKHCDARPRNSSPICPLAGSYSIEHCSNYLDSCIC